jgi:DNA-binding response OmpR family regulator
VQCIIKIHSDKPNNAQPLLRVEVKDNGTGINKEHQSRIFDRFFRVEGHHEADGHGTGIGLSLVHEFVTLLHGEINVESTPEEGSDFSVTLPLGKDHLSAEEYIITQVSKGEKTIPSDKWKGKSDFSSAKEAEKGKMKILIIEDNEDLRFFIREALAGKYNISEAENGRIGMNSAFTTMPDLIVTDIMMPDLDGIDLCRQLKNDELTSHIPIVMLTARATSEDKISGLRSGADDYIIKPFNMDELATRISNLLELRNKLRLKYSKFHLLDSDNESSLSVDDRFMARVLKIINTNFRDFDFDVASLQEHLGMSKTHITRKLNVLTGLPPGILIRNVRLEKASEMLRGRKGNITEISNSVGISNPSNFTKSFRKYFGVSPKEYLKH